MKQGRSCILAYFTIVMVAISTGTVSAALEFVIVQPFTVKTGACTIPCYIKNFCAFGLFEKHARLALNRTNTIKTLAFLFRDRKT